MRKYIILYTGLLLSVSGCSLLELDESTGLNREEAYSYFSNVKGLATYVYILLLFSSEINSLWVTVLLCPVDWLPPKKK